MSSPDTSSSAPSLPQLSDPPEIEATPLGGVSVAAGVATVSATPITGTAIAPGVVAATTPTTASTVVLIAIAHDTPAITHDPHDTTAVDNAATPIANVPAPTDNQDVVSIPKQERIRMSYINKCVRANKLFFQVINNAEDNDIPQEVYLNGKKSSLCQGREPPASTKYSGTLQCFRTEMMSTSSLH